MTIVPDPKQPTGIPVPPLQDDTAARTCIVVLAVLGSLFLVIALVCGGGAYFAVKQSQSMAAASAKKELEREQKRVELEKYHEAERIRAAELAKQERVAALKRQREAEERRTGPPVNFAAALEDLKGQDRVRHAAAIKYLETQAVDEAQRKQIALGLLLVNRYGSTENRSAAMHCLLKWADAELAPQLAASMDATDPAIAEKLELLAKYKDKRTYTKIASLLEDSKNCIKAKETLQAIGPDTAGAVAEYLLSKKDFARDWANKLLVEFGVDVETAKMRGLFLHLQSSDREKNGQAAANLAAMKYDERLQPAVLEELNALLAESKNEFVIERVINALLVWGDASSVQPMEQSVRSARFDGYPYRAALEVIGKFGGKASVPMLIRYFPSGNRALSHAAEKALVVVGPDGADQLVAYFNDVQPDIREAARRVLDELAFARESNIDELIIDQCMQDLASDMDQVRYYALRHLSDCQVVESKSTDVVSAVVACKLPLNRDSKNHAAMAIAQWATQEHKSLLISLLDDKVMSAWATAFRRMLALGLYDDLKQPTGGLLSDSECRSKAARILIDTGSAAEPLVIEMLDHGEIAVEEEACRILKLIGGQASLAPLRALAKRSETPYTANTARKARDAESTILQRLKDTDRDGEDSSASKRE